MRLVEIPNQAVEIEGKIHTHTLIGLMDGVNLIGWAGFNSKKPITCPDCIELVNAKRQELCIKYGWEKWPV